MKFNDLNARMNYREAVRIELKYDEIFKINAFLLNSIENELSVFKDNPDMNNILNRLCKTIISKNPLMGFANGIQNILAALLFHSTDYVAFWIFKVLIDCYGLKSLYNLKSQSMNNQENLVKAILKVNFKELDEYFSKNRAESDFLIKDLINSMILKFMNMKESSYFFFHLFDQGIIYIYKVIIIIFAKYEQNLISATTNMADCLRKSSKDSILTVAFRAVGLGGIFDLRSEWKQIIDEASKINLNDEYLINIIHSVDVKIEIDDSKLILSKQNS